MTVSNSTNDAILERLFDEAYEELYGSYWIHDEEQMQQAAAALARQRFEEMG
jgi:hypothetical protein